MTEDSAQQARIARHKELALARRRHRPLHDVDWSFARCREPLPPFTDFPSDAFPNSGAEKVNNALFNPEDALLQTLEKHSYSSPDQGWERCLPKDGIEPNEPADDAFEDALADFEVGGKKQGIGEKVIYNVELRPILEAGGLCDEESSKFNTSQIDARFLECSSAHDPSTQSIGLSQCPDGPLKFSMQQIEVLHAVAAGKSVFMTGSAGTGKSYLLGFVIRTLRRWLGKESVYVTASTGLAACALGGTTLHSFSGIGLGTDSREQLAGKVLGKKESRQRWRNVQALIIDEISMIDGDLFDKLDYVARIVRHDERCFGGIQLIVTGDFFQLPPVGPPNPRKYFAFEADCWDRCFDLQIELKHVFRQSDGRFVSMLNEIRKGVHTPQTIENLRTCCRVLADDNLGIAPTRLYPLKVDVKEENTNEMKALARESVCFIAHDTVSNPHHRYVLDHMRAEKELHLCVGAQVMLIKNLDTSAGLVNGSRGVVVGFSSNFNFPDKDNYIGKVAGLISPTYKWPVVRFACDGRTRTIGAEQEKVEDGGVEVARRIQVPLILAWALSVHKCQGMTLDRVETDLSKAFDYGMVYVALSRVKGLEGLRLTGFDPGRIKVNPKVALFYDKLTGCGVA